MFKNYFKTAWRNLFRQKTYSLLNLFGLAIGISCGLLLTLHIKEELSYEKSFPKHDRIYRVVNDEWSKSSPPLAGEMMKYFPEIKSITRFSDRGRSVVSAGPNVQGESKGYFADSSVVDVFDLKAVAGKPVEALSEPNAIVVTRSMAKQYFGNKDPLNQKLVFNDKEEMWVKAVIEDFPSNSHIQFDYLASMSTFYKNASPDWTGNRGWMFGWTYVAFKEDQNLVKADAKLKEFYMKYYAGWGTAEEIRPEAQKWRFQPLTDIHLHSNLIQEMGPNSSIIYIYIFIGVEVLILLIACVNFINLFTTQALKRIKEIGIRKILGAGKGQLVLQFMGEAFMLTCLGALLAICLYQLAIPFYNNITGKDVSMWELFRPVNMMIIVGMVLLVGILSGLFPALYITQFDAAGSLKSNKLPRSSASLVRKGLVVFQFVVSGLLIISTILIYQQMKLFHDKELGFDRNNVIVARLYGNLQEQAVKHSEAVEQALLKNPDVLGIAKASNVIGDGLSVENITPLNPDPQKQYPSSQFMRVDEHYLDVMNITLKSGRNFSRAFNDSGSFIVNERAAALLGFKDPIGAAVVNNVMGVQGKIVGVVKDFHFASLHHQVEPLVLEYKPEWTGSMFIKIKPGNPAATISFLESTFKKLAPNSMFSYGFLDDKISGLYKKENNMSTILKVFAVLAILISCLGLFGLTAYAAEVRTKEIGIRKVIGASMANLLGLLSKDFVLLVLAGNLIAWPIAWYVANKWLQEFTYKIHISWTVFLLSAIVTLAIAVLTIGYHCIRTATANPVKSLRSE
ncbi:ABC transporter permease [Paraflavitalea soli]|uniref:ABC transporter permease n=1 Tax=Paraflavitalea soli TaxID=2315862 RepID=A0A3B7MPB0_9BACT|nr:ABC transporter permease [Paraflavitalea soli]AXY74890.1 ABC transporter permease [Paraflavitalea soli]